MTKFLALIESLPRTGYHRLRTLAGLSLQNFHANYFSTVNDFILGQQPNWNAVWPVLFLGVPLTVHPRNSCYWTTRIFCVHCDCEAGSYFLKFAVYIWHRFAMPSLESSNSPFRWASLRKSQFMNGAHASRLYALTSYWLIFVCIDRVTHRYIQIDCANAVNKAYPPHKPCIGCPAFQCILTFERPMQFN